MPNTRVQTKNSKNPFTHWCTREGAVVCGSDSFLPHMPATHCADLRPQPFLHLHRRFVHADRHTFEGSSQLMPYLCECHETPSTRLSVHPYWVRDFENLDWRVLDWFLVSGGLRKEEGIEVWSHIAVVDGQLLQRSQRLK